MVTNKEERRKEKDTKDICPEKPHKTDHNTTTKAPPPDKTKLTTCRLENSLCSG